MPVWDDLNVLLHVRREGSLAGAAARLGVDKATVGRRITALEESLGVRLLTRGPRQTTVTPLGLKAARVAEDMEGSLEGLLSELGTGVRGVVRLTLPAFFVREFLISELPAFQARHPGLEIRMVSTNAVLNLSQRQADVALRNEKPPQRSLLTKRAGELGSALYGSRSYLRKAGRPASRAELAGHCVLGYEDALSYQEAFHWLPRAGMTVAFRASETLSLVDATRAGLGLAVLPCCLGDSDRTLERISFAGTASETIYVISHPDTRRVARVRAVVDWVAGVFQRNERILAGRPSK